MNKTSIFSAVALAIVILFSGCVGPTPSNDGNATANLIKTNFSVVVYEGIGCPHCANTIALLEDMKGTYDFQMELKEIRYDPENMKSFEAEYARFGVDPAKGGIPTLIINGKTMVIGELGREAFTNTMRLGDSGNCPSGAYTSQQFSDLVKNMSENPDFFCNSTPMNVSDNTNKTTTKNSGDIPLMVLIPAAISDSALNPCTLAIIAMLLAIILQKEGKKKVILSGIVFSAVVFICYFLIGLGVMKIVGDTSIQKYFFSIMLAVAGLITLLEIKAYFFYKPGMGSIEIPMFLRPKMHEVMNMATSLPMVAVVAVFCSLVLLPCSSGPYLMVLSLISMTDMWTVDFLKVIGYLVLYNAIFVLPFLAITLIVAFGIKNPGDILSLRDKYVREMHLLTGLIMLALTVSLALFIFQGAWFN